MEKSSDNINAKDKDEVSVRDLILTIREWINYLLSKWLIIVILGIVGASLGYVYSTFQKPIYTGELTFVLEDSKSSSLGSYAGIANQFGIDLGGGGGGGVGVFSGDNILSFLKSRLMVEKTLLSPVLVGNQSMSLAELYISTNNFRKGWIKNPELKNINFPATTDRSKFSLLQDSILNIIYEGIAKNDLLVAKPDKKSSFISVSCGSANELFAKAFIERLVLEATEFYVATKTKRSKANVDILQAKADSLERLLNRKVYSTAVAQDLNLNPAKKVASVGAEVMLRDKVLLQTVYAEVIKNLEISRMSMAQETPLIQIIDRPILPLKWKKIGWLKGLFFGGLLGGMGCIIVLLGKKIYGEIMR
ncbi:Chain length determinant protein [Chitinophaga sp. CF118]|uniref:hypothetical protein n=1 Tax=Chitinophaga sp. CF118 TaxID=1884367 RepID=UPI0008E03E3B|nr:hypothetical protein [Chitinophaga sp. CF118]SFE26125.1 Chain length determinant protein [Chitinophaga sp. CF118]